MGTSADKLNKIIETKNAIKTAINAKYTTPPITDSTKFADYPSAIDDITTGLTYGSTQNMKLFDFSNVYLQKSIITTFGSAFDTMYKSKGAHTIVVAGNGIIAWFNAEDLSQSDAREVPSENGNVGIIKILQENTDSYLTYLLSNAEGNNISYITKFDPLNLNWNMTVPYDAYDMCIFDDNKYIAICGDNWITFHGASSGGQFSSINVSGDNYRKIIAPKGKYIIVSTEAGVVSRHYYDATPMWSKSVGATGINVLVSDGINVFIIYNKNQTGVNYIRGWICSGGNEVYGETILPFAEKIIKGDFNEDGKLVCITERGSIIVFNDIANNLNDYVYISAAKNASAWRFVQCIGNKAYIGDTDGYVYSYGLDIKIKAKSTT